MHARTHHHHFNFLPLKFIFSYLVCRRWFGILMAHFFLSLSSHTLAHLQRFLCSRARFPSQLYGYIYDGVVVCFSCLRACACACVCMLTTKNRPFNFCIWKIFTYITYILTPIYTVRSRNSQAIHYFYHASRAPYAHIYQRRKKSRINEFKTGFSLLIWMQSISIKDICLSCEQQQQNQNIWTYSMRNRKSWRNTATELLNRQSRAMRIKKKWRLFVKTRRQKIGIW